MILAPAWYAEMAGAPLVSLDAVIAARHGRRIAPLATRLGPLRGLLAHRLAGEAEGVAMINGERGLVTLLLLEAWVGRRRRVVVLELIPRRPDRRLRRLALDAWTRLVVHPAMRRALAAAHVLSAREREAYSTVIGLDPERVREVRWALSASGGGDAEEARDRGRRGVLASGRAWCDWPTLFAAARGRSWELTVVCARRELARVEALNRDRLAVVRSELPLAEHARLLGDAAVYAIPLRSDSPSAGQVRLMAATDAGAAVVASDVPALAGYAIGGETAELVPAADPGALGDAIDRLLADPELRARLSSRARERAAQWTYREYFDAIRELIVDAVGSRKSPRAPAG